MQKKLKLTVLFMMAACIVSAQIKEKIMKQVGGGSHIKQTVYILPVNYDTSMNVALLHVLDTLPKVLNGKPRGIKIWQRIYYATRQGDSLHPAFSMFKTNAFQRLLGGLQYVVIEYNDSGYIYSMIYYDKNYKKTGGYTQMEHNTVIVRGKYKNGYKTGKWYYSNDYLQVVKIEKYRMGVLIKVKKKKTSRWKRKSLMQVLIENEHFIIL